MSTVIGLVRKRSAQRMAAHSGVRRSVRVVFAAVLAVLAGMVILVLAAAIAVSQLYASYAQELPSAARLSSAFQSSNNEFFLTTQLYDRTGKHLLYKVIDPRAGDRQWLNIEWIPPELQQATIAIEDRSFLTNPGYDIFGILRALRENLRRPQCILQPETCAGAIQGGSTITQQLVKNVILSPNALAESSYKRKFRELLIAAEAANRFSKSQILEWYLNTNFYGNLAYGVDAAARVYFGKSAVGLNLAESALLAAIPQYPGLNPIDAPADAKRRQERVLKAMVEQGDISAAEAEQAAAEDVLAKVHSTERRTSLIAPHYVLFALSQLVEQLGQALVYRGGLTVRTALDLDLQDQVECVARTHLDRLNGGDALGVHAARAGNCDAAALLPPLRAADAGVDHKATNTAVTVLDPRSGQLLAMVGSYDYWRDEIDGRFNVAVDGLRQPGSAFKPFTYLTAFSQGYTPATMVLDVRTAFDTGGVPYVPDNYDRKFHGPQSLRSALANSYNIPAVQVMSWVGVQNVVRAAHLLGINTLQAEQAGAGLALTLGGGEVTLLDMTYAYGVLANNGTMAGYRVPPAQQRAGFRTLDPITILRIEDRAGNLVQACGADGASACDFTQPQQQPVLSPELAYLITDVLSDEQARVPAFGTGNALEIGRPAAAKTGTTNNYVDGWTIGYTPQLAVGVWVGNSDNSPMDKTSGLMGAAAIWNAVMRHAVRVLQLQAIGWDSPPGIVPLRVCFPSGLLPTDDCKTMVREIFVQGTQPTTPDNVWQKFRVNRDSGRLATVQTPAELVEERVYQILPAEAADWIEAMGMAQPPREFDTLPAAPDEAPKVQLTAPGAFTYVRQIVPLVGTTQIDGMQLWRVQFGAGLNPETWSTVGGDRTDPVRLGELERWDTTGLSGLYTLQLMVVRGDQQFENSTVQVTVDNQPPEASLINPGQGEVFSLNDESIIIEPRVRDDLSLAFVEILVDGKSFEKLTVAPYTTRWRMRGAGAHTIAVRAVDAAGNETRSSPVTVTVR